MLIRQRFLNRIRREVHHIAIVGSGPSGFYTAKYLLDKDSSLHVDVFEKLPTPFGLVRFGVAPDHSDVKSVTSTFFEVARNYRFRYFGNIEVCDGVSTKEIIHQDNGSSAISLSSLLSRYSAVVLGYGATSDKELNLPGEHLEGVISARRFVNWYNGHPDYSQQNQAHINLDGVKNVVIVGQGNVALDCARILTKQTDDLNQTDISLVALNAIRKSNIQEITIVGRRGHAQSAFTIKELRELSKLPQVHVNIQIDEIEQGTTSSTLQELEGIQNRPRKRIVELIQKIAEESQHFQRNQNIKTINIRFLLTPIAIFPSTEKSNTIAALMVTRNKLIGPPFAQKPILWSADNKEYAKELERIPCDLLIKSVGYKCEPLRKISSTNDSSSLPFDFDTNTVPHMAGRVINMSNNIYPNKEENQEKDVVRGLYVVGWLKRGPQGIIGTNISDAKETVSSILEDLHLQKLQTFPNDPNHKNVYDPFPINEYRYQDSIDNNNSNDNSNHSVSDSYRSGCSSVRIDRNVVNWEEYLKIEAEEVSRGQMMNPPRERVKLLSREEMLTVAKR